MRRKEALDTLRQVANRAPAFESELQFGSLSMDGNMTKMQSNASQRVKNNVPLDEQEWVKTKAATIKHIS